MRVLIISDVHANPWALNAVLQDAHPFDHVLCAGDLVNYGPDPANTIALVRRLRVTFVQGNHDLAVACGVDPRASAAKKQVALAMRDWTRQQLSTHDLTWLSSLPRQSLLNLEDTRFQMVHATMCDTLYDYRLTPSADVTLMRELTSGADADVLVVGHTHLPLVRQVGDLTLVNPGSVGQPLDGDHRTCYALWEDDQVSLFRVEYDIAKVCACLGRLPICRESLSFLMQTLRNGMTS